MDKYYDYEKAKRLIEENKEQGLVSANLGMEEDWDWTVVCIFPENEIEKYYNVDLENPQSKLAGINSSYWATPVIVLEFAFGMETTEECWILEDEYQARKSAYADKTKEEE